MNKKQKTIVWLSSGFIFITLFCISFGAVIYHQTENIFYDKVSQLIATVTKDYPEIEQELVASLKNYDTEKINVGKEILKQYGYSRRFVGLFYNQKSFSKIIVGIIFTIAFFFSFFVLLLIWLEHKNKRRIGGLAKYLYNINEGEYTLKPQAQEDEFSVLEDELYKTVVMLRESRETAKREKSNLAANLADISHQIKTPLTAMALMIELLADNRKDSEDYIYVERISAQIDRLNQLVSALLNLSKMDAGILILEKKPVNVYEMLSVAVEPLAVMMEKKKIKFYLQDNIDVVFKGDFYWSSEAILNIIKNCIEHTPQEGDISITYEQNPISTQIVIEDNGEGFNKKDIPHLFTRFYKGENSSKDSVGIGLSLAKSIIEGQNGEIRVENKKTGGARFIIKFYK